MIELLDKSHNRTDFDCGNELLNNYLKHQAGQDVQRKLSACFVFPEGKTKHIQGYYTLSNYSIPLNRLPDHIQKKLPKSYQSIPTTLLGRLAIDLRHQGKGLGRILLIDALKRSFELSKEIGSLRYSLILLIPLPSCFTGNTTLSSCPTVKRCSSA